MVETSRERAESRFLHSVCGIARMCEGCRLADQCEICAATYFYEKKMSYLSSILLYYNISEIVSASHKRVEWPKFHMGKMRMKEERVQTKGEGGKETACNMKGNEETTIWNIRDCSICYERELCYLSTWLYSVTHPYTRIRLNLIEIFARIFYSTEEIFIVDI